MVERVRVGQSQVAAELHAFVEQEVLPGLDLASDAFWRGFDALLHDLAPANRDLLARRKALQAQIDAWHKARRGLPIDTDAYRAFLTEIGYLVAEGPDFSIETSHIDDEIAQIAGPQLVVPVTNARYALNAANARWGSLYDALYGTDAIPEDDGAARAGGYNPVRGGKVIAWTRAFLDEAAPLAAGSHSDVLAYRVEGGALAADLPGAIRRSPIRACSPATRAIRRRRRQYCSAITACMSRSPSTATTRSGGTTGPAFRMCCWNRPSRRSWTARIPSPQSMPKTRCWHTGTGSAS